MSVGINSNFREHFHAVQFYEDEAFLVERVADFLAHGIAVGEPCVVVATPEHNAAFAEQLRSRELAVDSVTFVDAQATLERFLVRGMPHAQRFRRVIGGLLKKAGPQSPRVRIYGEMVDLLWRGGEPDAAIRLEELWNDLARTTAFSLLCAYPMGNFYKESDSAQFEAICAAHGLVRPTERSHDATPEARDRKIALLEQRAAALEVEIEHRKKLEQRLSEALAERRRSEELLRDFVENATVGLHWVGADGTIEWVNDAELKLLGYAREEYIGRNIADFHADGHAIRDILARLARKEEIHEYEAPLLAKDGTVKWVAISSNVLFRDGRFVHTRCFTRDITARKRLEEQNAFLLEVTSVVSRSLDYRTRLTALAHVIVPRLADWCVIDIARDDSYDRLAMAHKDPELEELGSSLHARWPVPPDRDPVIRVLRSGNPLIVGEVTDPMLAGVAQSEEHLAELRKLGLRSVMIVPMTAHGRVVGTISFVAAETRGRYTEADLPLALDLASRAGSMIEIARLYHFADVNNRAKDEFLATLSHELRTPLTAILGWARMLSLGGLDEETMRTAVTTIEQSARMQAALIDDLLDVSRVVSGKLALQSDPVDLSGVVSNVLHAMQLAADAKQIRIETTGFGERVVVQGDETRLQQIVWNLLSNAIKFSEDGARVRIRLEQDGGRVRLVVADEGRGIAPSFLPFAFDPFRQGDSALKGSHGGLGLGLAIVKYLVEAHGGTVVADSAGLGKGATFTVTLPLARRASGAAHELVDVADLTGVHVLVVDDDDNVRRMLGAALGRFGAEVDVADGVASARLALHRRRPHVIITDVAMPEEDGLALLRELRANEATRHIPVFALTAFQHRFDPQPDFDAFLRKPIDPAEIARRIAHTRN